MISSVKRKTGQHIKQDIEIFPVIAILLMFCFQGTSGQFFTGEVDPGRLRWDQVNSGHFKVIYPVELKSEAVRMTDLLEFNYDQNSSALDHRPRKIPVVLHNHSVYSNGFVAVAPWRMELITTPSSDMHSQDHFEQLALHEFRHVIQVDKLDQGMTRVMKYLIGEQARGLVAGLMPFWYLEGDAVDAETKLSLSGRGRLPSFEKEIKAILLEKESLYSFEKSYYGSFRDYVPSHYDYGYQMVTHGRNKYGDDLWSKMIDFTARNPYTLYPFYFGLKKYTGLSKSGLYRETFTTLKKHWEQQASNRPLSEYRILNKRDTKNYTSYQFPEYLNDTLYFAEKSGIDQIDKFVLIDKSGKEINIYTPGFSDPANISVSGDLVVWAEYKTNERWDGESYSQVKSYNIKTGKTKLISRKSRYFSPDISNDKEKIVVTEVSLLNEYSLIILAAKTGEVISRISSPGNEFLQYPVWAVDGNQIFVTSMGPGGKCIKSYHPGSGEWKVLFDPVFDDIAELSAGKSFLLFRGTFSGIDNIYAVDFSRGECFRVTSSKFGAYYPRFSANEDKLLYSDYTSQGFDLVETIFDTTCLVPLDSVINHTEQLYRPENMEGIKVINDSNKTFTGYQEKKYSKISHTFNLHSWAPFYFNYENADLEDPEISLGVTLLSQNILNTAFTTLGYEYRDHDHYIHATFEYKGWYPVFRFSYDFGGLPFVADPADGYTNPDWVLTNMNWNFKLYLPLDLSGGKYIRSLQPSVESRFSRPYLWYDNPPGYRTGLTFLNYRVYFYNYLKTTRRDIMPRWGQVADINFIHAPFQQDQVGSQVSATGTLYLPGILRHHTMRLGAGILKQNTSKYIMNNLVSMPRGYPERRSEDFVKLTADYVFPIIYPDLNIFHILYIKRFKAAIFYDHGVDFNVPVQSGETETIEDLRFRSCGIELTSDFHFAHILFPFDMGFRYTYPLDDENPGFELLFSIDISTF